MHACPTIAGIRGAWIVIVAVERYPSTTSVGACIIRSTCIAIVTTSTLRRHDTGALSLLTRIVKGTGIPVVACRAIFYKRVGALVIETNSGTALGVIPAFRVVFSGRTTNAFTTEARFVPIAPVTIIAERTIQQILMAASTTSIAGIRGAVVPIIATVEFAKALHGLTARIVKGAGISVIARPPCGYPVPVTLSVLANVIDGAKISI